MPIRKSNAKKGTPSRKHQGVNPNQLKQASNIHANMLKKYSPILRNSIGQQVLSSSPLGQSVRIRLKNTGYVTRLFLKLTINTTIATGALTISPKSIFAAISRIRFTDYAGTDRINTSGFNLFLRNSRRNGMPVPGGFSNQFSNINNSLNVQGTTAPLVNPDVDGAVGTRNQVVRMEIPICYNFERGDLRGMIDANTIDGESTLQIDFATSLFTAGSDDTVFNAGAGSVTANSITAEVIQEFYLPQPVNGVLPNPVRDFQTVYELVGSNRSNSDFAVGADKLVQFPNNRTFRAFYASYLNNGILGGSAGNELTKVKFILGSGNYIQDLPNDMWLYNQRDLLGYDLPKGCYLLDFPQGYKVQDYGISNFAVTPGGTLVSPSLEYMFESLYQIGAPLSNLVQS